MKYTQPIQGVESHATTELIRLVGKFVRTQFKWVTHTDPTDMTTLIVWPAVWAFTENAILADGTILRWGPQGSSPTAAQSMIMSAVEEVLRGEGLIT